MAYGILLIIIAILVGSGAIGSMEFIIGILIAMVVCIIGIERAFNAPTNFKKGGDKDERH